MRAAVAAAIAWPASSEAVILNETFACSYISSYQRIDGSKIDSSSWRRVAGDWNSNIAAIVDDDSLGNSKLKFLLHL